MNILWYCLEPRPTQSLNFRLVLYTVQWNKTCLLFHYEKTIQPVKNNNWELISTRNNYWCHPSNQYHRVFLQLTRFQANENSGSHPAFTEPWHPSLSLDWRSACFPPRYGRKCSALGGQPIALAAALPYCNPSEESKVHHDSISEKTEQSPWACLLRDTQIRKFN